MPCLVWSQVQKQSLNEEDEHHHVTEKTWGRDSVKEEKEIPIGMYMWTLNERLGYTTPALNDTMPHHFQNSNQTDGYTGQYNHLGNLGSPRLSRLFFQRPVMEQFIFLQPYDFFYTQLKDFLFTNTKSPITNLSYHSCGNRENGEDHIRAYFASNINKKAGIGFKLDYLYGRGYYNNQVNSMFNASLYGYYQGEKYDMHAWISSNHLKMGENGGIEDDAYIRNPESFSSTFKPKDIPTILQENWNRNDDQTYYLNQRYHLGFYRDMDIPDSLKLEIPTDSTLLLSLKDSIRQIVLHDSLRMNLTLDSLRNKFLVDHRAPQEFIPVTSFIHTLRIQHLRHKYYGYYTPENYYTNHYYGNGDDIRDESNAYSIKNTFGVSLLEGFNKWAKAGLTAFATHEFRNFIIPGLKGENLSTNEYKENNFSVGGELSKRQGKLFHYNILGEIVLAGEDVGQFDIDGNANLNFQLAKDTLLFSARAYIKNLNPTFYHRHYHSQFTWWDNQLEKELRTRIEGTLALKRTRTALNVGIENITDYTYFATEKQPYLLEDGKTGYSRNIAVKQKSGNIQVFSAKLNQNFKFGILHLNNEIAYQKSSNQEVLPLPDLSLYSNLYILFRIAKVLRVELGGDIRYFTGYYAPDYAPTINQFTTQAEAGKVKIGNYPICNVYANMHLKHCRFYVSVNHVNAATGNAFLAPHYPINPLTIHFGLSWNFFN